MKSYSTYRRARTTVLALAALGLLCGVEQSFGEPPADSPEKATPRRLGYGLQSWDMSVEFPADFIKQRGDEDYRITSVAHGGGVWAVVMSKDSGYTSQFWETSPTFPQSYVRQHWADGRNITAVAYGGGMWAVVVSKGTGIYSQYWNVSRKFPDDFIKQHWNEGRQITSLTHGGGFWAVVMSKSSKYTSQFWKSSKNFPEAFVQQHWDDRRDITSVAHGGGLWAVVMSKQTREDPAPKGFLGVVVVDAAEGVKGALVQDIIAASPAAKGGILKNDVIIAIGDAPTSNSTEMIDRIKVSAIGTIQVRLIRDGKELSLPVELVGRVGTIEKGFGSQHWKSHALFPREYIDDRWEDGHFITSVAYGGGLWTVVMSKEDLPTIRELPKLPPAFFPDVEP